MKYLDLTFANPATNLACDEALLELYETNEADEALLRVWEPRDHFIVLGLVHELAVARSTLPLLFFQGGYGRFSPGSFVATPDPDLIQAAQMAETIRSQVEDLSAELSVNCGVLVKIRWDSVQVLAANQGSIAEPFPLGHRQPIIPPLGAAFLVNSTPAPPAAVPVACRRCRWPGRSCR